MSMPGSWRPALPAVVHEFTEAWDRGESPAAEDYLGRLDPADVQGAVDLIYREYCLAEADGRTPDPASYVARFPRYAEALRPAAAAPRRMLAVDARPPVRPGAGVGAPEDGAGLPDAGDSIGPYVLRRELGRGSFARVFLAEQADLENRLVVVKVATRSTREPWLLARARHAHIVEIVSHAVVDDAFQLICMPFWGGATLADVLAAQARSARERRRAGRRPAATCSPPSTASPRRNIRRSTRRGRRARSSRALSYDRAIAWVIARLAEALDHASSRDVTHGDVKPSNILLSADGNPMLLDFNLARDGAPALDPSARPADPGGTLAYMAPERLRAVAGGRPGIGVHGGTGTDLERVLRLAIGRSGGPRRRHLLAGHGPAGVALRPAAGRGGDAGDPDAAVAPGPAEVGGVCLRGGPRAAGAGVVRDFEAASGRPIAPALRAILQRCLDPDPDRRYRRA